MRNWLPAKRSSPAAAPCGGVDATNTAAGAWCDSQILLHHEAALRMTDHHGGTGRLSATDTRSSTKSATEQARSGFEFELAPWPRRLNANAIALLGEVVQEVFVPTPCCVRCPVDKQKRHRVGFGTRPLVDRFEHWATLRTAQASLVHLRRRYAVDRLDSLDWLGSPSPTVKASASVAVSDSQRICFRTVRSMRCSARSVAIRSLALGLPK